MAGRAVESFLCVTAVRAGIILRERTQSKYFDKLDLPTLIDELAAQSSAARSA